MADRPLPIADEDTHMQTHIVSHTHWDREWYLSYEQFRLRLVGLIDRLLDMMESQPDYRYFHLDGQTIVLEDYLEMRPEQEPRLRKLIADGRILVGPWYDMPDEFLVSGESIVRNLALGHRIARRFGTPMPVGYLPDLFGHIGQMPQLLRQFGLDNAILWRGFGGPRAEYWWEGPDGSRVLMMHLPPDGYCNATRVHLDPRRMVERATAAIEREQARTAVGQVLLMNGVDHVEPHPVIPDLARQLTKSLGSPVEHSTLPAYVDAVRDAVSANGIGETLDVIRGELRGGEDYANLLPGVFSARTYIKQANARIQTLLEKRAEPLASFAAMLGAPYPGGELRYAWKTLLQNHPHDSICGCSIDAVHEENMTRFARVEQVARAVVDDAATVVARAVPAAPQGVLRLVAINTTGEPFSGVLRATVDLPYESDEPRRVVDVEALDAPVVFWPSGVRPTHARAPDGERMPVQILSEQESRPLVMSRYETPWILRARRFEIAWLGAVPACGHATFDLTIEKADGAGEHGSGVSGSLRSSDVQMENAAVSLSFNEDGTVNVADRRTHAQYPGCGELEDVADVGDEYNYSPPRSDRRITSADARNVRFSRVHTGPFVSSVRVDFTLPLPVAIDENRAARSRETVETPVSVLVSIEAGSPRVSWHVVVDNGSKDHRLRILFPTGAESVAEVRAETAFGVARRPARRQVPPESRWEVPVSYGPTASFTEAGTPDVGAVVFSEGLVEYEAVPGNDGAVSKIGLTLLRCVGYLSREDLVLRPSGHAGPGLATPAAQCLGRHEFSLAFEPRAASPTNAALFGRAASFVAPPHVVPASGTGSTLAATGQFLALDRTGGAVLSACYRSDDTGDALLVRMFNPDAAAASVAVRPAKAVRHAAVVNLLGAPQEAVAVRDGAAQVTLDGHKIVTLQLS
jgi:mannosylglycerate hydrolase